MARHVDKSHKIALFGGTFDPVHLGHIHLAESAKTQLRLDEVRFLPCQISPHKLDQKPTPAADRLQMLRLATAKLPWAVVDDFEIQREGPSYSWQTAEAMVARFPESRIYWIMGVDQWRVLPQWARAERLAECVEFIVSARGEKPEPQLGFRLHTLDDEHPAAATLIRAEVSRGAVDHPWLDPAVSDWIRECGLYHSSLDDLL